MRPLARAHLSNIKPKLFPGLFDSQETVAWIFNNFVAFWQFSWCALAAFYFCEKVNALLTATAQNDILEMQEILNPLRVCVCVSCHNSPPYFCLQAPDYTTV